MVPLIIMIIIILVVVIVVYHRVTLRHRLKWIQPSGFQGLTEIQTGQLPNTNKKGHT